MRPPISTLRPTAAWMLPRLPYVLVHVGAILTLWTGLDRTAVLVCMGTYFARIFALSAGFHRYFAHRGFATSRPVQFALAVLGGTALQRGALWWAQTHRDHHRHTDTPRDIHAPKHAGFWRSHWGWFFDPEHRYTKHERIPDFARYPELVWLDGRLGCLTVSILYGLSLYLAFGWRPFLWGFFVSTVFVWHTVHWIQSMSHYWGGYRNFDTPDDSRNHWLLGVVSLGEYHNNHHHRPGSARMGLRWFEVDVTWWCLQLMQKMGLIWGLRDQLTRPEGGTHR